ncbi:hypothetical protein D3C87_2141250 [compost metagenome]
MVVEHMVRTVIGPEVIFHGGIGMGNRNFIITGITGLPAGPEQKLQVHHVVDDDQEF